MVVVVVPPAAADDKFADKVINLDPASAEVKIVGTLYKDMVLKPNILDEFTSEVRALPRWRVPPPPPPAPSPWCWWCWRRWFLWCARGLQ